MSDSDFEAEILENEVVIVHMTDGHIYHFPILPNGTVSFHEADIEPNMKAKREARRHLLEAYNAALAAFGRTQV
jgi:hypothetical protein